MNLSKLKTYSVIAIFLLSSHVCIGQVMRASNRQEDVSIDSKTRTVVIQSINELLIEQYIFQDVAEKMKNHLNAKLKNGDYDKLDDPVQFANVLREDLYEISKDNHFFIEFNPERATLIIAQQSQSQEDVERANKKLFEKDKLINFGFKKVEQLRGNIGYMDLRLFCNAEYAGETAVAAMNFLAHSDAVIIDIRDTPGGWPNMVQLLCSYFVKGTKEGRTHLNTFERRYDKSIEQIWTMSYVPGQRMYDLDLYILTSKYTGSGAEAFAYHLKNLKRAIIVGETTRGSAHHVEDKVILDCFVMHLPTGRPVNPISGTNWEGVGVEPHMPVPADHALDEAYLMALEKVLEKAEDEDQKFQINWAVDGLKAKFNPLELDEKVLEQYVGVYGERTITLEHGELFYQRAGPKYILIPLKENLFRVEGLDYFRIEFVADEKGNVTELVGLYDEGYKDPSKRTK
jgi:hypothetical protein